MLTNGRRTKTLTKKVAFVTGGTSGVGLAAASALAAAGASVMVCGRRLEAGAEAIRQIQSQGGEAAFVQADVTVASEVHAAIEATTSRFGRLDLAFNNSGIAAPGGRLADLDESDFDRVMTTNAKGVWLCMKYEIQQFIRQASGGCIINNSSVQGRIALGLSAHYTASKHAVEGLTKAAAVDYGRRGIRVNAIAPGMLDTPLTERLMSDATAREAHFRQYPIARPAKLSEIAAAVVFLASDQAVYINGVSLPIDGGYLCGGEVNRLNQ
ncbi:glucose 1-dehydrogenase [Bradyrhizobium sp. 23AC]